MNRIKRDLPIYVLSASLIFFGVSTATQADAHSSDTTKIRNLENQFSTFKSCVNRQLASIGFYEPTRDRYIIVARCI